MKVQIHALIANLILYLLIISPIIIISLKKSIYKSPKSLITALLSSTIIEIIFSSIIYIFGRNIFSLFIKTQGIVNYAVYSSKIIFMTSPFYGIKFLIPAYIFKQTNSKKTTILFLSKIVVNIIFIFIGLALFSTKGMLFSIPLCDLIYCIIYIIIFIKIKVKPN